MDDMNFNNHPVMKLILKLYITISIVIISSFQLLAQDAEFEGESDTFFPDFSVEFLHDVKSEEEILLPFIYNGYLYLFSIDQKLPVWRIFIGGDLPNPFIVNNEAVYFYDIYILKEVCLWT